MLTIVYGDEPKCIYNTNVYFKNTYESEWLESSLAKELIKDVDKSEVVSGECKTIDNEDWERQIEETSGNIIFIDEGNRFLVSKRFAELVKQSDNYFVLATREKLPTLSYSINEIYGFRESGKFHEAKQKYNEI